MADDPPTSPPETDPAGTLPRGERRQDSSSAQALPSGGEPRPPFVVGLAASAGGLAALKQFFNALPDKAGVSLVVVTHQLPDQVSLLPDLLSRETTFPVVEATNGLRLELDHVYTSPAGRQLLVANGRIWLEEFDPCERLHLPIDKFFRSLAEDCRDRAIGVVLSGTGADGTLGIKAIKDQLGMVMAQTESSAEYGGMPHSAIATDQVDYVLPVDEMPRQLLAYVASRSAGGLNPSPTSDPISERLDLVLALLRQQTGHDFTQYKQSTISRRVERRISLHHLDEVEAYVEFLRGHPAEVEALFGELLIGVTSFFRDPEAFVSLAAQLAELLSTRPDGHVLRIWIAGCSTGEEAYSIAMVVRELLDAQQRRIDVQIFATDLDKHAVNTARNGHYPPSIASEVSPERLARFFTCSAEDDGYTVKKEVRDMLVFAPQNLISDPPFTKLDLLVCRNLLIYLSPVLQKRLLPIFHYALRPGGLLFLGSSESVGSSVELFTIADKSWRIFRRVEVPAGTYTAEFPASMPAAGTASSEAPARLPEPPDLMLLAERSLLRELVPPTVIVREGGETVHIHGRTGLFLEPAPGLQTSTNIFAMAREGLELALAMGIREAVSQDEEVVKRGLKVEGGSGPAMVDLRIRQIRSPSALRGLIRVSFLQHDDSVVDPSRSGGSDNGRVTELERELVYARESHQGTTEELETSNEELKSANEELQSTNEELQSANEELETSKEEMQSLNEELRTVNAELQSSVDALSRANNDMKNLLNGTNIATVFLDAQLHIKRFTDQASNVIRLIPSDVGRPVGDLVSRLRYDRLAEDARQVLDTLVFKEAEVQGEEGDWYLMRILPYRTTDNVIDGLVLTFVNITAIRTSQSEQRHLFKALVGSPTSVFGQNAEMRVTWAFSGAFGYSVSELKGKTDEQLLGAQGAQVVRGLKHRALESGKAQRQQVILGIEGHQQRYDFYVEPVEWVDGHFSEVACVVTALDPAPGDSAEPSCAKRA